MSNPWYNLPVIIGVAVVGIIVGMALVVFWKILTNTIKLDGLIEEPTPLGIPYKASLARFQFLIFTFVVAGLFLLLSIESGTFVDIPESVLGLLGISGGSYVLAKGIAANKDKPPPPTDDPPADSRTAPRERSQPTRGA